MIYLHPSSEWLPRQRIWNTMYRSCGVWQISSTWTKSLTSCNVISWNPKLTDMMLFDDHQHWCRDHVKNHSNVDQFHMSRWPPNVTSEIMCQNHPQIVSLFMGGTGFMKSGVRDVSKCVSISWHFVKTPPKTGDQPRKYRDLVTFSTLPSSRLGWSFTLYT
jgi:hypothetical protein